MNRKILALGLLLLLPYLAAWRLGDLRRQTIGFEVVFFAAFGLYAGVVILALCQETLTRRELALAFAMAAMMQGFLIFTRPALSDDMYRYVWDGRVQAEGISPYRYPPSAPELAYLRDETVWPSINRRDAVTVYPPAAEMAFALLWQLWPDSVRWFQIAAAGSSLLTGLLLVGLLRALGRSPARVLIYLWSPLLAYETAHAAHLDALILPLLVGAWWARSKERDGLTGLLLGLATGMKFYPALLLPALWRPNHPQGRWRLPLAFTGTLGAVYLPYLVTDGSGVLGFLPKYLREQFNRGPLVDQLLFFFYRLSLDPKQSVTILLLIILAGLGLALVLRPAADGETALRRCIWFIGPVTLLSYTFFLAWKPVPLFQWLEFAPLYLLLLLDLARRWPNAKLTRYRREPVITN